MKFFIISDIHTDVWRPKQEYWSTHFSFLKDVDVMVIAGDNGSFCNSLIALTQVLLAHPHLEVVYAMGNHDYYGTQLMYALDTMSWASHQIDRLHVLTSYDPAWEYKGVVFIGGTLWTDYNKEDVHAMNAVQRALNDYRAILKSNGKPVTPNNILQEHYITKKQIFKMLDKNVGKPCVVVTHHQPFIQGAVTDLVQYGYCVDLEDKLNECLNPPKYWVHGHTHRSTWTHRKYKNGGVTFVSNQFGYPSESSQITGYRNDCILEISTEKSPE